MSIPRVKVRAIAAGPLVGLQREGRERALLAEPVDYLPEQFATRKGEGSFFKLPTYRFSFKFCKLSRKTPQILQTILILKKYMNFRQLSDEITLKFRQKQIKYIKF